MANHHIATSLISLIAFAAGSLAAAPPTTSPSLQQQMAELRALQEKVQEQLLAVPPEDQQRLADLLKQPDTGLIKLLPREMYDRVIHIRGGGAYYSFFLKTHEYGHGSDIELQQHRLSCGFAGNDYGYFLPLGDVPIEKAATVAAAAPDWAPPEAASRWPEFFNAEPVTYDVIREREAQAFRRNPDMLPERGVPDAPGNTYLLRSVSSYRSDVLVVFRVERKFEEDGSLLLSWKLLKRFPVVDRVEEMRRRREQMRRPPVPRPGGAPAGADPASGQP